MRYDVNTATFVKNMWLGYNQNINGKYKVWSDHIEIRIQYKTILYIYYCFDRHILLKVIRNKEMIYEEDCYQQYRVVDITQQYMSPKDSKRMLAIYTNKWQLLCHDLENLV